MRLLSFPPIADRDSAVLILGTMPGKDSLASQQYYAHPRNSFWKIMYTILGKQFSTDYTNRKKLLLNEGIALWDVVKACERASSMDSDILKEETNDITKFFTLHTSIRHIYFNGNKAKEYFDKYFTGISLPGSVLPSTSPANTIAFENKLKDWCIIKDNLKNKLM